MQGSLFFSSSSGRESYWPKKPGKSKLYWLLRYGLEILIRLLYRVKVEGAENVPSRGPIILAANHISAFDPVLVAIALRRRITALGNARYFQGKNGWFFRGMGQIPIIPGDDGSKEIAFAAFHEVLENGGVAGIFPEGNRSRDGKLHRGRLGVATLTQQSQVPVVPIGIIGSYEIFPKGKKWPKFFRTVKIRLGRPISYAQDEPSERTFTDSLMMEIKHLSDQEYDDTYSESRPKNS